MSRAALADAILLVHAAFVVFIVGGLAAVWIGAALDRPFARNRLFRAAHLAAIGFVVAESLLGYACPLTLWEDELRGMQRADGFLQRAVRSWLYWDWPAWVFTIAYVAFGALVAWTWWRYPPRRRDPVSRARGPC